MTRQTDSEIVIHERFRSYAKRWSDNDEVPAHIKSITDTEYMAFRAELFKEAKYQAPDRY